VLMDFVAPLAGREAGPLRFGQVLDETLQFGGVDIADVKEITRKIHNLAWVSRKSIVRIITTVCRRCSGAGRTAVGTFRPAHYIYVYPPTNRGAYAFLHD